MAAERPPLPIGYYVANLETVFAHALAGSLLAKEERGFLEDWMALPLGARRLWARLYHRRGNVFRRSRLHYDEIPELDRSTETLVAHGFLTEASPETPAACLLDRLTVAELGAFEARTFAGGSGRSKRRRGELLAELEGVDDIVSRLLAFDRFFVLERRELADLAQVTFFGNVHQDLSDFVRVDIAQIRYPDYELTREPPLFPARADLDAYLAAAVELERDPGAIETDELVERAAALVDDVERRFPLPPHRRGVDPGRLLARAAHAMARELERRERIELAAALHRRLSLAPGAEPSLKARSLDRLGLVLAKLGRFDLFDEAATPLVSDVRCDEISCHLVRTRRARLTRSPRPQLREAPELELALLPAGHAGGKTRWRLPGTDGEASSVEETVLLALGGDGLLAENALYRSLFGLLLWEEIFAPIAGAFQQPYQMAPLDVGSDAFFFSRKEAIEAKLAWLRTTDVGTEIERAHRRYERRASAFVAWDAYACAELVRAAAALGSALVPILDRLARHPRLHGRGLPDLLLFRGARAIAIEVKGPGDTLRLEQRLWIDRLIEVGLPVRVVRVRSGAA